MTPPIDNVMVWCNTFVGGRTGFGYNSSGSPGVLKHRRYWSMKNNYYDASASKSDLFPGTGGSGTRVGNWPIIWGVGQSGNVHGGNTDVGPAGFDFEWPGINSLDSGAQTSSYAKFVNRAAWNGSVEGAGLGDYHVQADSPLRFQTTDLILPFDLEGRQRFAGEPAGALTWTDNVQPQPPTNLRVFSE